MTQQVEITVKVTVEAISQYDEEKLTELANSAIIISAIDWKGLTYVKHEIVGVNSPGSADLKDKIDISPINSNDRYILCRHKLTEVWVNVKSLLDTTPQRIFEMVSLNLPLYSDIGIKVNKIYYYDDFIFVESNSNYFLIYENTQYTTSGYRSMEKRIDTLNLAS